MRSSICITNDNASNIRCAVLGGRDFRAPSVAKPERGSLVRFNASEAMR